MRLGLQLQVPLLGIDTAVSGQRQLDVVRMGVVALGAIDCLAMLKTHLGDAVLQGVQFHMVFLDHSRETRGLKAPHRAGKLLGEFVEFGNDAAGA